MGRLDGRWIAKRSLKISLLLSPVILISSCASPKSSVPVSANKFAAVKPLAQSQIKASNSGNGESNNAAKENSTKHSVIGEWNPSCSSIEEDVSLLQPPLNRVLPEFKPLLECLRQQIYVPVALPTVIPKPSGLLNRAIYAGVTRLTTSSYSLALNSRPHCVSGSACTFAYLWAKRITASTPYLAEEYDQHYYKWQQLEARQRTSEPPGGSVQLIQGIEAYYFRSPYNCSPHCGDSSIEWERNDYRYGITLRQYGQLDDLIDMANSAIENTAL